ncbi:MAG: CRISPR-associated protein Cas6 [Candidatus Parabeggiatoa sp. nov. 2]|nr:MAG: CRISPR-associated protein Cas6 [Beggiatoa sp. 4572_84]RKZ62159.1 MAG: CRISPR-associated protein Cas6 [Gammaproteobacteria bacterium]
MRRIRLQLSKKDNIHYKYLDILHDALVNAWRKAGATSEQITGMNALPWNFAALGGQNKRGKMVHTLIVSTPDATLAKILRCLNPADIRYTRASTVEHVDFAGAQITIEDDPILPNQNALGVLMLSPLAIRQRQGKISPPSPKEEPPPFRKGGQGRIYWHTHLGECDLSAAINHRLSRIAGRDIQLQVQPDNLYIRCNPDHSVLVPIKQMRQGKNAFVIGMSAPLVLMGCENDLRFAWYAGLGEKTRNGFGCIGLAEQGVGR